MDAESLWKLDNTPGMDRAVEILIRSVYQAAADSISGSVQITVSITKGQIRQTKEVVVTHHN